MKAYLLGGLIGDVEIMFDDLSYVRLDPPHLRIMSNNQINELVIESTHLVTLLYRDMPISSSGVTVGKYHISLTFPLYLSDFITPAPVSETSRATPVLDFEMLRRLLEGGDTACLDQLKGDRNAQY